MPLYQVVNGTSYHSATPSAVIDALEKARRNHTRIHVSYGDSSTGMDWLEEFDTTGYVGRSMGPTKVPLLLANRRSSGGGAILDHCIVRIRARAGGNVLYSHPSYQFGDLSIRRKPKPITLPNGRTLNIDIVRDGETHASFESTEKARRWVRKLGVVAPIAI
jgi:hypothetical protein